MSCKTTSCNRSARRRWSGCGAWPKGCTAAVYVKVESLNPGGSIKDRVGLAMIAEAERRGWLRPGGTIIEATAGNTGVGLAMVAAVKGYRCIFVLPDKMSGEKIAPAQGLRRRGRHHADRRRRPTRPRATTASPTAWPARSPAPGGPTSSPTWPTPRSTTAPPARRSGSRPRARSPPSSPASAPAARISGVGRYLKEQNPEIKIIGADPEGSVLSGDSPKPWKVEGIGEDFVPKTLNGQLVDDWVRVGDAESFHIARALARREGHPRRRLERHRRRRGPALRPPADRPTTWSSRSVPTPAATT